MRTILNGDVEQRGELSLSSTAFSDGDRMPEYVGQAHAEENPPLEITGVPDAADSLILFVDDPDSEPVVDFVWNHWLVFNINSRRERIPRGWAPTSGDVVVAYNDVPDRSFCGPAPPDTEHRYRFKLFAVADRLGLGPEARPERVAAEITAFGATEVLAQTQLAGRYHPHQSQG